MAWRGRETALKCNDIQEFVRYLRTLNFHGGWRPSGMVLHNTATPSLQQWWFGGTAPETRMRNLRNFYENEMGWSAGPHAFVDGVSIWVMTDFNVKGVHSPSWNGTRLGIEMVGDYATESDEAGMGLKVMNMTVPLFGECHSFFGWEPSNTSIKLHKEDPATDHDCPGKNIVKSEFLSDVVRYMGEGGDHEPDPAPPIEVPGEVYNLQPGDFLNVRAAASASSPIIGTAENGDKVTIVGETMNGSQRWYRCRFGDAAGAGVEVFGWANATYIKRTDAPPSQETWHENITATVFGGPGDEQETAYGGWVDSNTVGISLPYKWRSNKPAAVIVEGPGGRTEVPIIDVGPWNIHNPEYVLQGMRPLAEKQYQQQTPAQNGQVPTNDAGIDLTVPVSIAIGINGKGKIRWRLK